MKIAVIVRKMNMEGGVQRHALNVATELAKLGHEIKIYAFVADKERCFPEMFSRFNVVSLSDVPRARGFFSNFFYEHSAAKRLAFLIDPDTEVLNPYDHGVYKVAVYYKKLVKNIPSVWTMCDMPTKMFDYMREKENGHSHNPSRLRILAWKIFDFYDRERFIKKQDIVVVLDDRDRGFVKKYFGKDAEIVRSGIDVKRFSFSRRVATEPRRSLNILMNGIFFPHRRFEDGIMALSELRKRGIDARLEIVGDYRGALSYKNELDEIIKREGLCGVVNFTGRLTEERFLESYAKSDIFLFPNHLQSWGLAVFEAMACGLPVVVSSSAGASEVLTDGVNALIVSPKNPEELARAAGRLAREPELYNHLSENGRRFVVEDMSWRSTADRMYGLFTKAREMVI